MKNLASSIKHHSLGDWDFEAGHFYFLDNTEYVSSPTSLCTPLSTPATTYFYVFLKDTLGKNIPNGRFITDWRFTGFVDRMEIYLRQQPPFVHRGTEDGYVVLVNPVAGHWRISRYTGGTGGIENTESLTSLVVDTWYKIKLDFYEYLNADLNYILRIELFVEIDGEWVSQGHWDDSTPLFSDSEDNRLGFALRAYQVGAFAWVEDTQIWEKT